MRVTDRMGIGVELTYSISEIVLSAVPDTEERFGAGRQWDRRMLQPVDYLHGNITVAVENHIFRRV